MLYARVLRSPHPHARITVDRRLEGEGAARREGDPHPRELPRSSGAPARLPAASSTTTTIKKITTQRRYAFNNPVRFVGEPVAAVAAVNRHVAEEALRAHHGRLRGAAVRPRHGGGAEARARRRSGRKATSRRTTATRRSRSAQKRGNVARGAEDVGARLRGSLHHGVRPQRADGAARVPWRTGKATSSRSTRRPAASPTAATTWRATSASPTTRSASSVEYMGGNFGNKNQNQDADLITAMLAKEAGAPVQAGALAQGRLHRHARPLADDAVLQGRHRQPTAR